MEIKALSMFAGGGVAETYFKDVGIEVKVANELLENRAHFYKANHPDVNVICGDVTDPETFERIMEASEKENVNFIIATPPCQGMSTLGLKRYDTDGRNILVYNVIDAIDRLNPDFAMIENVPKFIKLRYLYEGEKLTIAEILERRYRGAYNVETRILNARNYGVPQSRPRVIVKIYKPDKLWPWPQEEPVVTLREAIGELPSLEAGQDGGIKWHKALRHNAAQVEAMKYTAEGESAMKNKTFYPKKKDGSPVRGFHNTYKRMKWDEPAPAITTNSALISGHNNVHPGRPLPDGTWSDARALTLREVLIVSSLPLDWNVPEDLKESFVREIIGESIPPLLSKKIVEQITLNN